MILYFIPGCLFLSVGKLGRVSVYIQVSICVFVFLV